MAQQELDYDEKTNKVDVVERTEQATAEDFNEIKTVVNANAQDAETRLSNAPFSLWQYDNSSTDGGITPSGKFRLNSIASPGAADILYLSSIEFSNSQNIREFLLKVKKGAVIRAYDRNDITKGMTYTVTANASAIGGLVVQVPVSVESFSTFLNDAVLGFTFLNDNSDSPDLVSRERGYVIVDEVAETITIDINNKNEFYNSDGPLLFSLVGGNPYTVSFLNSVNAEVITFRCATTSSIPILFNLPPGEDVVMQEFEVTNGRWDAELQQFTFIGSALYEVVITIGAKVQESGKFYMMKVSDKFVTP